MCCPETHFRHCWFFCHKYIRRTQKAQHFRRNVLFIMGLWTVYQRLKRGRKECDVTYSRFNINGIAPKLFLLSIKD
jgi:hypothetical protein